MKMSIVVLSAGKAAGQSIPIPAAQFTIGRDPQCNLRPGSAMISKRHCALLMKSNQAFLRDFDSSNGTFLNNQPVKGEVPLNDGDIFKVGPLEFKVVLEGTTAPSKPTPPPQPKKSSFMDDDAAAMLLNIDDEEGVSISTETDNDVPIGNTLMEIPSAASSPEQNTTGSNPADDSANSGEMKNPDAKAADAKKKPVPASAQDAAKAILDKLRQGRRK